VYVDAAFSKVAAATLHLDTTFAMATYSASVGTSAVHAQPLYLVGSGSVSDLVIVGTNQTHVIAFDAASGAKVWDQTLGTPVPSTNLACAGNINPYGIAGTPVIDEATRTIYVNTMTLNGSTVQHMVHALDANTGMERTGGWPVDLNSKATSGGQTFSSPLQNQRGALALLGGRVLVPFGGHIGDCGDYRGWVVSISATDPTSVTAFATRVLGGGIWAPSGVATDGTSAYFATGNTMAAVNNPSSHPGMYGDGETVLKLPPDMSRTMATTEYFVPTNWSTMDDGDADIGGTGPLLVDVPGATPSKLIVQLGKDRKAYLIDRDAMGGQSAPLSAPTVAGGAIINAAVSYRTAMGTYVVFRGGGSGCPSGSGSMTALRISVDSPPAASVVWCAGATSNKSPAVTMTDANGTDTLVWIIGNDNKLHAYDGDTGAEVLAATTDTMAASSPFVTPIVSGGRIFVAANTQTYAFKP
jgi:outer membrane protein assembly factor BamB